MKQVQFRNKQLYRRQQCPYPDQFKFSVSVIKSTMLLNIKGIVKPKIKILSSFTHPQVVPNPYVFLLLNTKEDTLT